MFLDLPVIADLVVIRNKQQQLIDENLCCQNACDCAYKYAAGQQVLIKTVNPNKLKPQVHGPYSIIQVYQNRTIDVAIPPFIAERINIRIHLDRIKFGSQGVFV